MTEEQFFIKQIEERTGLSAGKDFGFILGTQHPYGEMKSGFSSSGLINGYRVWRKQDTLTVEADFISTTLEENMNNIVKFLNTKIEKSPNGEVIILGEYDDGKTNIKPDSETNISA